MTGWLRRHRVIGGLAAACLLACAVGAAQSPTLSPEQADAAAIITVPLAVEVYDGVPLPDGGLTGVIRRVNAIYAPAGVRFTVAEARDGLAAPEAAGWTLPRRIAFSHERRGYLDHLMGRLRGVSVSFTHQPKAASPQTNGLAYGASGVVLLRPHPAGIDKTAETLAHELAHTLGLNDLYAEHDRDRLCYGYSATRTDVKLTDDDVARIRTVAAARAGRLPLARAEAVTLAAGSAAPASTTTAAATDADQSETSSHH